MSVTNPSSGSPATSPSCARGAAVAMLVVFAALLGLPAITQTVAAFAHRGSWPSPADLVAAPFRTWVGSSGLSLPRRVLLSARAAAQSHRAYEAQVEDGWVLGRAIRPLLQRTLATALCTGSARVIVGRDGVLYFRPAVEHVIGPSFLDARRLLIRRRAGGETIHPDPRPAILAFKEQLASRGITLVLVPVPDKATVEPEHLAGRTLPHSTIVDNPGFAPLLAGLRRSNILVFDPTATLRHADPAYLASDTHWRPETMAAVAEKLASFIRENVALPPVGDPGYQTETLTVTNRGDLAAMLELPAGPGRLGTESVVVQQVITEGDMLWRLDTRSDVLLLGDSFTNIYSLPAMGWGEGAGFAEHLSLALGRKLDTITRNDSGAWATRSLLAQELARGRDRLAGKRVVVWELASRELSLGDWKPVNLELGTQPEHRFFLPDAGAKASVSGTITEMGVVPRPRSAPYADFIVALHLEDLKASETGAAHGEALVFVLAMKDYELTPAAHLRVGQRISVKLRRWSDVATQYDLINRGELLDGDLMMQDPCWGEEVTQ
jgi:hypothetical protein